MILDILIVILILFLALILLLLFVPFKYSIRASHNENCFFCGAKVSWLFGLFRLGYDNKDLFNVRLFGILIKVKNGDEKEQGGVEENKVKERKSKRKITKKGVKYLVECFADIVKRYRPKKFLISGQLGFEDPSITGFLQGLVSSFRIPFSMEKLKFRYDEEIYDGTVYVGGKLTLYYLVFTFLKLFLYEPTRVILK